MSEAYHFHILMGVLGVQGWAHSTALVYESSCWVCKEGWTQSTTLVYESSCWVCTEGGTHSTALVKNQVVGYAKLDSGHIAQTLVYKKVVSWVIFNANHRLFCTNQVVGCARKVGFIAQHLCTCVLCCVKRNSRPALTRITNARLVARNAVPALAFSATNAVAAGH